MMKARAKLKRCSKCGHKFPATLKYFHHHKGRKDGLHAWCIGCKRSGETERNRRYYEKHRDEILASTRAYALAHPEQQRARQQKWYQAHKELSAQRVKANAIALRKLTLERYGGRCQCCGETQYEFLAIDHIDGGGRAHRRAIPGQSVYRWLKHNNFPKGFQVLCHNCNMAKAFYGACPHQTRL